MSDVDCLFIWRRLNKTATGAGKGSLPVCEEEFTLRADSKRTFFVSGIDADKALQSGIDARLTCASHGDYQRIRTPYLYPDDDNIDLFCKDEGDALTVTDLAETAGWLRMQSAAVRRPPEQNRLIAEICAAHGVEFHRGMLQARCRSVGELAAAVERAAQAALRVSEPCFPACRPSRKFTVMDGRKAHDRDASRAANRR